MPIEYLDFECETSIEMPKEYNKYIDKFKTEFEKIDVNGKPCFDVDDEYLYIDLICNTNILTYEGHFEDVYEDAWNYTTESHYERKVGNSYYVDSFDLDLDSIEYDIKSIIKSIINNDDIYTKLEENLYIDYSYNEDYIEEKIVDYMNEQNS